MSTRKPSKPAQPASLVDHRVSLPILLLVLALSSSATVWASEEESSVKPITQLTVDDAGAALRSPSSIFFDRTAEELFVINGADRVVVYSRDFFPLASMGAGRGIASPQGVFVDRDGLIYVCQGNSASRSARITIFNAAFFPLREIKFDNIPEAENFSPNRLVVSRDNLIYVSGSGRRGLLVLDADGKFLRWLRPIDRIFDQKAAAEEAERMKLEEASKREESKPDPVPTADPDEEPLDSRRPKFEVPEELRPKAKTRGGAEESGPDVGPVQINEVVMDTEGHLYLLSEETSKVYVYNAEETFLFSFGEKGGVTGKMSRPRSLAVDEKRKVAYVVDYMRHTILVFDLAGRFIQEFGGRGRGPGWFNFPTSLTLNRQGHLMVADLFNNRVQVLDVDFRPRFPLFQPRAEAPTDGIAEEPLPDEAENSEP